MEMNRTRELECQGGEGGSALPAGGGDAGVPPHPVGWDQLAGHGRDQGSPLSALPVLLLM